jgi:hydroxyethylthiazole kinase-like uncharacterized protein yjeF
MRKVLTSAEMREVDRLTTEKYGITSLLLMENAAHAAARVIIEKLGGSVEDRSILILCGKGNNGGDGAALARILWQQAADVEVCLFGLVADTKEDARTNFDILRKITDAEDFETEQADLAFEEITGLEEWLEYDGLNFHSDDPDVIVDALFGTGLTRRLDGVFEQVAAFIDAFYDEEQTLVVSLDLPSGLDSDRAEQIGSCPRSNITVTFTAPKLANVLPPASDFNGELHVASIGSPCDLVKETASQFFETEPQDVADWLAQTEFSSGSYKNQRGHLLIIAGSESYSGAAVLCGNAAMRSGVGLVTIATPKSSKDSVASRVLPEVMVRGVAETESGAVAEEAFNEIQDLLEKADAIAIGSGLLSEDESTRRFVKKVIENRRTPVVVDADALNLLSPFAGRVSSPHVSKGSGVEDTGREFPLIMTPHEGEFMRLLGADNKDAIKDRVQACRDFATKHKVILVLKGERSLIAEPGGKVIVNPTGNSGLGKAGNGDTLTGILAGFVAQAAKMNINVFETVVAAVYIAGVAGDIAERKYGKRVMTASDVRECLTDAFEKIEGIRIG